MIDPRTYRLFLALSITLIAKPAPLLAQNTLPRPPSPVVPVATSAPLPMPTAATATPRSPSPIQTALPLANPNPNATGATDVPPLSAAAIAPSTGTSSIAISPMSGSLSLRDVLREADVRNPDLIAARSLVVSAQARVLQAARTPLRFVVQPAIAPDIPGGVGRLEQLGAGFSQQVSPGIRVARTVAAYDVTLARGLAEATARDVRGRVVDGYYALAATQSRIAAAQENVRSASNLVTIARLRERAGAVGSFEVLRVTVELRRAQSELSQARSSLHQNAIALGALVGRAIDPTVTLPPDALPGVDATLDAANVVERALSRDPTSAQLRATLARSSAQLDAARAQRRPEFSANAGYLVQRAPNIGNRTSGGVTASLAVSLPVVDYGTIRGAELEARASAATTRAQIAGRELQLRALVAAAREAIESSRARLDFAGESLRQAMKGLETAQFGFRQGALGTLDIISARTAAIAARTERDQARGDYAAAVAKLRILLGDQVTP